MIGSLVGLSLLLAIVFLLATGRLMASKDGAAGSHPSAASWSSSPRGASAMELGQYQAAHQPYASPLVSSPDFNGQSSYGYAATPAVAAAHGAASAPAGRVALPTYELAGDDRVELSQVGHVDELM